MALNLLKRIFAAAVLSGACLCAQTEIASTDPQKPLKQLSLEELSQVQVTTTSKEPVPVNRTPAAIDVITSEDIRRSGVTNIADALRLAPGVEVGRMSSDFWAVGIRGLQSNFANSVLVLVDGRSVYSPFFGGVFWDVQNIPLQDVDRIEVIRGPGGTIWGPDAVNGVINIITKSSADTQGVMLTAGGGTVDQTQDVVQYGGHMGGLAYRVYGKGFADGPEYHMDGNNYDNWHQERGGFRADWAKNGDQVMLEGELYGGNSPHLVGTSVVNDAVSGGAVTLRWQRALSNGSDLNVESYFERTIRIGSLLGETRDTFDVDVLDHVKVGAHQDWSFGGGLRWSPDDYESDVIGEDVLPHKEVDTLHSLFAQDEIHTADERLSLTLGVKIGYNNFTGFDAQPTMRLLYAPNKRQTFWAAVTRAVTTPSRLEEGFLLTGEIAPGTEIVVTGSSKFKSEYLLGYEAGYRQLFTKNVYLDLAAFHNQYSQLQSFTAPMLSSPAPGQTDITIAYANQIGGNTSGVEIAPSWQMRPWWRLTGSYSYVGLDMHANSATSNISSTGSVPTYEGSTPHHQAEVQSTIDLPKRFEFDQFYRWASTLPAQKVPGYQTMDVRFGWKYSPHVEISLVGQNLLQPNHFEWGTGDPSQSLVGIKRAIFGAVTLRY